MKLLPVFLASWRWLLPAGIALAFLAVALGVFESDALPAWIFFLALVALGLGVASFLTRTAISARAAIADFVDADDNTSSGPAP